MSSLVCRWVLLLAAVASGLNPQLQLEACSRRSQLLGLASSLPPLGALALTPMTDTRKRSTGQYYDEGPAYLKEPTEEFKKDEAARAAFRKRQAAYRTEWDARFDEFAAAKTDEQLAGALTKLTKLVATQRGLPYGLRLADMITQCRRVKAKAAQLGGWGTPVEIEYMSEPSITRVLLRKSCRRSCPRGETGRKPKSFHGGHWLPLGSRVLSFGTCVSSAAAAGSRLMRVSLMRTLGGQMTLPPSWSG